MRPPEKTRIVVKDDWFVDAFVGYRAWLPIVRSGRVELQAVSGRSVWYPGRDMRADCSWRGYDPSKHRPPGVTCDCGLHAFNDPGALRHFFGGSQYLWGEVYLWGDVQIHDHGYRAEFGRVAGVYEQDCRNRYDHDIASMAANQYCVPLLSYSTKKATFS